MIHIQNNVEGFLDEYASEIFEPGEKVAVKLHFGEPANPTRLSPHTVKSYVDVLKEIGTTPFLFDSPVMYNSPRNNVESYLSVAKKHGFFDLDCPVIISNDSYPVETPYLIFNVCRDLVDADGVLLLSHFTGHECCGAGASIKNAGMGGVTQETKRAIHMGAQPLPVEKCSACGKCQEMCPTGNIERTEKSIFFGKTVCIGCSNCVYVCPEENIKPKVAPFDFLLALSANCVLKKCTKLLCVNIMKNTTRLCDCTSNPGQVLIKDMGVLVSRDIVSVDKAGYDLVFKHFGFDVFKILNKKTPLHHIKEAQNLGMGSLEYKLECVE